MTGRGVQTGSPRNRCANSRGRCGCRSPQFDRKRSGPEVRTCRRTARWESSRPRRPSHSPESIDFVGLEAFSVRTSMVWRSSSRIFTVTKGHHFRIGEARCPRRNGDGESARSRYSRRTRRTANSAVCERHTTLLSGSAAPARYLDYRCFALRSTMSTAAAMTSSSGKVPNMIDGHATTPVSIDTAASSSAPRGFLRAWRASGRWPRNVDLVPDHSHLFDRRPLGHPGQDAVEPHLGDAPAEGRQFADDVGAQVAGSLVVRQLAERVERQHDQVDPCRPMRVERRLGVAGELGDPGVGDGVGTFVGQHVEGARATSARVRATRASSPVPGDLSPGSGCHLCTPPLRWPFLSWTAPEKLADDHLIL